MDIFKFFSTKPSPKDVAKDRLQLILIHDRSDFSPEVLDMIKGEILKVLERYAEFDGDDIDVRFTETDEGQNSSPALIASIPIKGMKNR